MIEIQLRTPEEFWELNTKTPEEFAAQLQEKYPVEYKEVLNNLHEFHEKMYPNYKFEDMIDEEDLIEEIDDFLNEDTIINYYVKDTCGTDRGDQILTLENGYAFKEDN